jgi:hypothetical protein
LEQRLLRAHEIVEFMEKALQLKGTFLKQGSNPNRIAIAIALKAWDIMEYLRENTLIQPHYVNSGSVMDIRLRYLSAGLISHIGEVSQKLNPMLLDWASVVEPVAAVIAAFTAGVVWLKWSTSCAALAFTNSWCPAASFVISPFSS